MSGVRFVEGVIGVFIVGLLVYILSFYVSSMKISEYSNKNTYVVSANFENVDGISKGSDVKIGGVKIGYVESKELNYEHFDVIVKVRVKNELKIPDDSILAVNTEGFMGGKYLNVSPGGSEVFLDDGGVIDNTQSSLNLESLISKFLANKN